MRALPGAVALLLILPPAVASARQVTVDLLDTAVIAHPALRESSGVAAGRRSPGVFWTINDSGNRPVLFALDSAARSGGSVTVDGAGLVDWEDLAAGPCPRSTDHCLYIGDIGDNRRSRRRIVVYAVPEPAPPGGDSTARVSPADSLVLRYPDGPHDAEAMAITADRWLVIITKDPGDEPRIYRVPLDSAGTPRVLEPLGSLPIATGFMRGRLVTGAASSPDGRLLAVRTYISLHLFRLSAGGRTHALLPRNGVPIPVVETQGEAITFDHSGRLVLTSERGVNNHAILSRLRLTGIAP